MMKFKFKILLNYVKKNNNFKELTINKNIESASKLFTI